MFKVLFAVMSGSTALGSALPQFASYSTAHGAIKKVFEIINRVRKNFAMAIYFFLSFYLYQQSFLGYTK